MAEKSPLRTLLVVWSLFLTASFLRSAIPGINEPHYLGKSVRWHDPDWCARDFFLASSDAHPAFYGTFGQLTRISLPAAAVIGRAIGLLLLAVGWIRLSDRFAAPPVNCMVGWPEGRFTTPISRQATPMRNPVPSALEQASFAAHLLA